MTRLLVSVRSTSEARLALAAGVDLVDAKDPEHGSLGPVEPAVLAEIVEVAADRAPVSAALGELLDFERRPARTLPGALAFAKVGLAGCADMPNWPRDWQRLIACLPLGTAPVAVVYADWRSVSAPSASQVLRHGGDLGCRALLVDTCLKSGGDLLHHVSLGELDELLAQAGEAGMLSVLGGSLACHSLPKVLALKPDYVAVRGAACRGGRSGVLDPKLVQSLVALVRGREPSVHD